MTQLLSTPAIPAEMEEALIDVLKMAGLYQPGQPIEATHIKQASDKLRSLILQLSKQQGPSTGQLISSGGSSSASVSSSPSPAASQIAALSRSSRGGGYTHVLLAGQLGIITHQLKQSLLKSGAEVAIGKEVDDVLAEYQKKDYGLVIVDLFMPTEREGLIVLDEIKRLSLLCNLETDIIMLAPPSKDKTLRERCRSQGVALYLEKAEGWQETVLKFYKGEHNTDPL